MHAVTQHKVTDQPADHRHQTADEVVYIGAYFADAGVEQHDEVTDLLRDFMRNDGQCGDDT